MAENTSVLEYKCPCCGAPLIFGQQVQKMTCAHCGNEFELEAVRQYNAEAEETDGTEFSWDETERSTWSESERESVRIFTCPACGGELTTDENTAATFCPFCENPAILPGRLAGGLKPDGVLPFKATKDDAKAAFLKLCKGKPLLPKGFLEEHRIEKITGIYVPFWLYDCNCDFSGQYQATRIHSWSDSQYHYTRTEHFLLRRRAVASFSGIPMDGSKRMDDAIMESIEPFDYSQIVDFETAYLSGFFADKYDVEARAGESRVQQRVQDTINGMIQESLIGFATAVPTARNLRVNHGKAKYVLLPVWVLNTRYQDKIYTFAMNGQTGKMTGVFPICPKRSAAWFAGIFAGVTALVSLIALLVL